MADNEFEQVREDYVHRLQRQLRRVPLALRQDAVHEVLAHIEDGCRQAPGDVNLLRVVLERLGLPEEYGHELGLQLLLQANRAHPSLQLFLWIGLFWASTSLVGAFVMVGASLVYIFGLAFLADGLIRLIDPSTTLKMIQVNDASLIPAWRPLINIVIGVFIISLLTLGLISLLRKWSRGKLSRRGLAASLRQETVVFPKGWEHRTTWAVLLTAAAGLLGCSLFGALGGLFPIGNYGPMSLPQDFFKNPLTFLAFLGGIVFLVSPLLGIIWVAWREQRKDHLE